jgi:hypothetical protein
MTEVVKRLMADMRKRLAPSGGKETPSVEETAAWGAPQIAWPASLASGCGLMLLALGGMLAVIHVNALLGVLLMFLMFASVPLSFGLTWLIQRSLNLKQYQKLLEGNERFALGEYSRLLQRQIGRAQRDPGLGGPKEVARLSALQAQLDELLDSGAGLDGRHERSRLGDEAAFAESVLESYNIAQVELQALDARLPGELRAQLEAVDRAARQQPGRQTE